MNSVEELCERLGIQVCDFPLRASVETMSQDPVSYTELCRAITGNLLTQLINTCHKMKSEWEEMWSVMNHEDVKELIKQMERPEHASEKYEETIQRYQRLADCLTTIQER